VQDLAAVHSWQPGDELEHADVATEAWWWWGWSPDAAAGVFVGLEVRGRRFDYWAGLVRAGHPYLLVEELDGTGRRSGLELKPPEMWAGHECDAPFRQWSVGNEAHGVFIDDPEDALDRAYGLPAPCTFDIEWYATEAAIAVPHGYRQTGEVDARVELLDGVVAIAGPGERVHVWGAPYVPGSLAVPSGDGALGAHYRRSDGRAVRQALGRDGFAGHVVPR
jgi:hypothetical protein